MADDEKCAADLSLAVSVSGAHAAQSMYATGLFNISCGAWLADRAIPIKHEGELEWVLGFVTGAAIIAPARHKADRLIRRASKHS